MDTISTWIAALLTLAIFSFLYRAVDMAGNQEQTKDSRPIVVSKYVIFSSRPNTATDPPSSASETGSSDLTRIAYRVCDGSQPTDHGPIQLKQAGRS